MLSIRHRSIVGRWQTVGADDYSGVWPTDVVLTSDRYGSREATYILKRKRGASYPDLLADTPVMIDVAGVPVWSGRIKATPEAENGIQVQAEGWQYHLDDKSFHRVYAHNRLGDWKDTRSASTAIDLDHWGSPLQVTNDRGGVVLGCPRGNVWENGRSVGITLDLGPQAATTGGAKRIVLQIQRGPGAPVVALTARGHANFVTSGGFRLTGGGFSDAIASVALAAVTQAAGGQTMSGTFTTAYRYVTVFIANSGATYTAGADDTFRISSIQVFTDTAYESGNTSILKSDVVVKDALARACPLLSTDTSQIAAGTIDLPEFAPEGPQTPRQYIDQANSPLNWLAKVDVDGRLIYRPYAASPLIDVGAWGGSGFESASENSSDEIVTEVLVRGSAPDETPMLVTRTQTGTIIDRQGGSRAQVLDSRWSLPPDLTFANALGDAYLTAHRTNPLRGKDTIRLGGARRTRGGSDVHPAHLLLLTGELARLTHRPDPDTGGWGRPAVIDQVTYRHDDQASDVNYDNSRDNFEALQARLGLLIPA